MYNLREDADRLEPANRYRAVVSAVDGDLVGFYCVGREARVPGIAPRDNVIDVGVGMNPALIGRGHGYGFVSVAGPISGATVLVRRSERSSSPGTSAAFAWRGGWDLSRPGLIAASRMAGRSTTPAGVTACAARRSAIGLVCQGAMEDDPTGALTLTRHNRRQS